MKSESPFADAPKFISQRFATVKGYVWFAFFPENSLNKYLKKIEGDKNRKKELKRLQDIIDEASTIILIFLLKRFFEDGTERAKAAVDTLKDLEIPGFQIGSRFFSERNDNVMQGKRLAKALMQTVENEELVALINNSKTIQPIMNRYRPFILNRKNG